MMFAQNTLSETNIQKFTPLSETTSIPAPFKWESPRATCPDHCYKVPESHEAVGCPGHCSFSCETGCPDHCCSLPTVSTLPICPSECHASCHELYALCTVVKFLHFPYLFVQAIARLHVIICVPVTAVHNN